MPSPSLKTGIFALPLLAGLASAAVMKPMHPVRLSKRVIVPTFEVEGCFREPPHHEGRALKAKGTSSDSSMTTEFCAEFCSDYMYFGTEYGRECFCGNELAPHTELADGQCTMSCTGNADQTCGAGDHLNVYRNTAYVPPSIATVDGFTYLGCRSEPENHRALPDRKFDDDSLTPQKCADLCLAEGFLYSGLEFSRECFCAGTLHGGKWEDEAKCTMLCSGDSTSFCGGAGHLSVYGPASLAIADVPDRSYSGCVVDDASSRVLNSYRWDSDDMTAEKCSTICSDFKYSGVELGHECYCGNDLDAAIVDDAECNSPCYGKGDTACGAPDRLSVYAATQSAENVETVGDYHFLQCGVDSVSDRVLDDGYFHTGNMTVQSCANSCSGFAYFGLEFGKECFCGNEYTGAPANEGCFMRCVGNPSQICGGKDRISVYTSTVTVVQIEEKLGQ